MDKKAESLSYEQALGKLEALIEAMEDGDVPLAELVAKFEEGSSLLQVCQSRLKEAELKIEKLKASEDETAFEPLSPEA